MGAPGLQTVSCCECQNNKTAQVQMDAQPEGMNTEKHAPSTGHCDELCGAEGEVDLCQRRPETPFFLLSALLLLSCPP